MATNSLPHPRGYATICLPVDKDYYNCIVQDPVQFRAFVDQAFQDHPELFPAAFADGYDLKDARHSVKLAPLQFTEAAVTTNDRLDGNEVDEVVGLIGEDRVTRNCDELWSARKIMRRTLWHERDHFQQIIKLLVRR